MERINIAKVIGSGVIFTIIGQLVHIIGARASDRFFSIEMFDKA